MLVNKNWIILPEDKRAKWLSIETGISELTAQLLINRGIKTIQEVEEFLDDSPEINFPPIPDIDYIGKTIGECITNNQLITIHGDYDVDGITSCAVFISFLKNYGAYVDCFIPSRHIDGYGLNNNTIKKLQKKGTKLLITVDCGISNYEEVKLAKQLGIKVIITDHHNLPQKLPPADFIINPKIYEDKNINILCGVGTVYHLISFLEKELKRYKKKDFLVENYLDLVCLGTIADVVELIGINRNLVKRGLEIIKKSPRVGIEALIEVCQLNKDSLTSHNVAFQLTPRLNAAGRLKEAITGLNLLLTTDKEKAFFLANELDKLNKERQDMCEQTFYQAVEIIESNGWDKDYIIVVAQKNWHHGIIGIVGSRLLEHYFRPIFIISIEENIGRGSARGGENFHIFEALDSVSELLEKYGGHKNAGGFTINVNNIEKFREQLLKYAHNKLSENDLIPTLKIEKQISLSDLNLKIFYEIQHLKPFGQGNPFPVLCSLKTNILEQNITKDKNHLILKLTDNKTILKGVFWNNGNLYPLPDKEIDIAYKLRENIWQGNSNLELEIVDIRPSNPNLSIQSEPLINSEYIDTLINQTLPSGLLYSEQEKFLFLRKKIILQSLPTNQRLHIINHQSLPIDRDTIFFSNGKYFKSFLIENKESDDISLIKKYSKLVLLDSPDSILDLKELMSLSNFEDIFFVRPLSETIDKITVEFLKNLLNFLFDNNYNFSNILREIIKRFDILPFTIKYSLKILIEANILKKEKGYYILNNINSNINIIKLDSFKEYEKKRREKIFLNQIIQQTSIKYFN